VGLQLPGELISLLGMLGYNWPEADEEKLYDLGNTWTSYSASLSSSVQGLDGAAASVWQTNSGDAVSAVQEAARGREVPAAEEEGQTAGADTAPDQSASTTTAGRRASARAVAVLTEATADLTDDERWVLYRLRQAGVHALSQAELEERVDLPLYNTQPGDVRVYHALFRDIPGLPWDKDTLRRLGLLDS
jgi:hypothetical protein